MTSAPTASLHRTRAVADDGARWAYRPDVDGLRAVAILLVVVYHVWFGRVSGGVDVFLMLSAFFLTRGFLHRMAESRPFRPAAHLVHMFRRLVPAAAVTLVGILAVAWLVYPPTSWTAVWRQTWASLAYVQNWVLAADAVDYYARSDAMSPVQHFWSLSVQGQAFVLWVALLALCQVVVRRTRVTPERAVVLVFGAVFALSLAYSIVRTTTAQQLAYFDTGARLWEFAAGSLLVAVLPHLRLRRGLRSVVGWAGLIGLLVLGAVVDVRGGFPGVLALWPVLCAAGVVASGAVADRAGPQRLLASPPLRWVGRHAYALYLVHWPILVTWMVVRERAEVGVVGGLGIVVLSLAVARVLSGLVDAPVRAWRRDDPSLRAPAAVLTGAAVMVAAPLAAWQGSLAVEQWRAAERATTANPGAAVVDEPESIAAIRDAPLLPAPTALDQEWVQLPQECSGDWAVEGELLYATCFETERVAQGARTIAVIGDSHSQQITAALLPVAERRGWGVVSLVKGACSMGLDEPGGDERCDPWREAAISLVERAAPAAVVTVVTRSNSGVDDEAVRPGIERFLDRMRDADIDVLGVRDNPRFDFDMYGCIDAASDPRDCAVPRSQSLADRNPADDLDHPALRQVVDLTPWICPDDLCDGIIGNVAVYRDDNHLTRSYATTLAPMLADRLPALWR